MRGEIDRNTIVARDFNTPLSTNSLLEQQYRPNGPKKYIKNFPPNGRIHILHKCTQNILQPRSYVKSQNKS